MMDTCTISLVRDLRNSGKLNKDIQQHFNINNAQYYAITIFADKMGLSVDFLAENVGRVKDGMSIGQVAEALGFRAEDTE